MNKHSNKRTVVDGKKFASGREARRWQELKLLERAGQIKDLRCQVSYELAPAVMLGGRKKPALRYVADFVYVDGTLATIIEDSKSPHLRTNRVYRIKKHLMMSVHGLEITET